MIIEVLFKRRLSKCSHTCSMFHLTIYVPTVYYTLLFHRGSACLQIRYVYKLHRGGGGVERYLISDIRPLKIKYQISDPLKIKLQISHPLKNQISHPLKIRYQGSPVPPPPPLTLDACYKQVHCTYRHYILYSVIAVPLPLKHRYLDGYCTSSTKVYFTKNGVTNGLVVTMTICGPQVIISDITLCLR